MTMPAICISANTAHDRLPLRPGTGRRGRLPIAAGVARDCGAGHLIGIEIVGDPDCGRNGGWLLAQRPQAVEGEQRPGWLDAIEPLPGILQEVLCDHRSTRYAELS
jgi:hypothetical protein